MSDNIDHPKHYNSHPSGVECIQVAEHMGFNLGNAFKYVFRHADKGKPIEDLGKARWYMGREIARRQAEAWADFPSDPRYEISTAGRVRMIGKEECRTLVPIKSGYMTFITVLEKKSKLHYVHRAVAETFIREIPEGSQVCHYDGNRSNNHVTNLRISSVRDNLADKRFHGTHYVGGNNPSSVLAPSQVQAIRALQGKKSETDVGHEFGVSRSTIGRIWRGESWADHRSELAVLIDAVVKAEPNADIAESLRLVAFARYSRSAMDDLGVAIGCIDREIAKREAGK